MRNNHVRNYMKRIEIIWTYDKLHENYEKQK